ncbi:hypothetical protein [Pseudomonas plecoglossicida]|uniref:hypothetical protein n=1 Tax=Pseudomonas plecoglossicida TaxID=70775 RepID=UPI00126A1174|nr:hypothetical protein [Pseudomonas plecoglossicida]
MKRYKRRSRGALHAVDRSDPVENLKRHVAQAATRLSRLGVNHPWQQTRWSLSPTLFRLTGKHTQSVSLNFSLPPLLGSLPLQGSWADATRLFFIQRENEQHKSISSHRTFVAIAGYIKDAARGLELERLTPAILDHACECLKRDVNSDLELYKRYNLISEFARRCSEMGLCHVDLQGYTYHGRTRPASYGGQSDTRLDDPALLTEHPARGVAETTFKVLGELYRNVPRNHKYRVNLLIITLLVCLGRRLSEITLLPKQKLERKASGYYFLYLKLKGAQGSQQYELVRRPVISEVVPLVEAVLAELQESSVALYACAEEMCRVKGPDLTFLSGIDDSTHLYYQTLVDMGLPSSIFRSGWFFSNNLIKRDCNIPGGVKKNGYLLREDVEGYCWSHYQTRMTHPLYQAGGQNYLLKDMLLLKWHGTSSGHYVRWIADTVTSAIFDKFLLQLEPLCVEFASSLISQKFTSHDFRHTMNDALDKGGLPEVMQTEYFGRKNPVDTKAYQHTSPQVRALQIREEIKLGRIGGAVADRVMRLPQDKREAFLATKVRAVHDLGNGMCFHAWESGPCERHKECDGCHLFGWAKNPVDPGELYEELLRQAAQHLIQLEIGDSIFPLPDGADGNWQKHLSLKFYHILARVREIVPGTDQGAIYDYINSGGFDKHVVPQLLKGVEKGYELYVKFREKFNDLCVEYAEYFGSSPFVSVQSKL